MSPLPPPVGGIARWTERLLPLLQARGVEVVHLDTAVRWRRPEQRELWRRVAGSMWPTLQELLRCWQTLRRERPALLHLTSSAGLASLRDALILRLARWAGCPAVVHYRTELMGHNLGWALRLVVPAAARVVVLDSRTWARLRPDLPEGKLVRLPNFVALQQADNWLAAAGQPCDHELRVLFTGRLDRAKGVVSLIEACAHLRERFPQLRLELVGPCEGDLGTGQPEWVCRPGVLEPPQVFARLARCHLFVLPSRGEGFPNSVLEAMAAARPVVATSVGALEEMLGPQDGHGPAGWLYSPQAPAALSEVLAEALSCASEREKRGREGRRRVELHYSCERVLSALIGLWQGVARNGPRCSR